MYLIIVILKYRLLIKIKKIQYSLVLKKAILKKESIDSKPKRK